MAEEEGMWRYIIAEDYDGAISWYHHQYRKALSTPVKDKRYITSTMHVLYFVAEYARGNKDIMPIARVGTQHWYDLFVDSRYSSPYHLAIDKRAWYYFWHHYFCNQQDIRKMLISSRGY